MRCGHGQRRWVGVLAVAFLPILLSITASGASEEEYVQSLAGQLNVADGYLNQAGDAIGECNVDLVACLQQPAPYADRIDAAVDGLNGVRTNLSAMTVPERYVSSHALLERGFQRVTDGLALHADGLRERDLDKIESAADLVRSGKADIETASLAILARPPAGIDIVLVLGIAVAAIGVSLGVLMFIMLRRVSEVRREEVVKPWATCPVCGEVLDQFWTYRMRQIKEWRETHLQSHRQDTQAKRPSRAAPGESSPPEDTTEGSPRPVAEGVEPSREE